MDYNNSGILIEGLTSISALINAIRKGVNNRKIYKVYICEDVVQKKKRELSFLKHASDELEFVIEVISNDDFSAIVQGSTHGGIAALCSERMFCEVEPKKIPDKGVFALLDGIEDPYNYAYTVRSLYAAGFDGIILPPRNWSSADAVVAKSSAGTSELMPTLVDDPVRAISEFKKAGYKIVSAGIRDSVSLFEADLSAPIVLIIGGEKRGISRSLLDLSDAVVRIDYGRDFMGSLTTSCSSAVIAFEIMRQNR